MRNYELTLNFSINILLGNDMTDKCCAEWNRYMLEVRDRPIVELEVDVGISPIYPACVTNRSKTSGSRFRLAQREYE